jgi:hypothetical protein
MLIMSSRDIHELLKLPQEGPRTEVLDVKHLNSPLRILISAGSSIRCQRGGKESIDGRCQRQDRREVGPVVLDEFNARLPSGGLCPGLLLPELEVAVDGRGEEEVGRCHAQVRKGVAVHEGAVIAVRTLSAA